MTVYRALFGSNPATDTSGRRSGTPIPVPAAQSVGPVPPS